MSTSISTTPNAAMALHISFRGQTYTLSFLPNTTLVVFSARLEELTEVPPSLQKLLYKGKKIPSGIDPEKVTLEQTGLKDGVKIQMLGSTAKELDGMKAAENENQRRGRIMKERALKAPVKLRSTGSGAINSLNSSSSLSLQYRFYDVKALEHLPNPESALALLTKLSEDPAIRHVMQQHKFKVGLLTELAPHERPDLLGLNENAGQIIYLRLRTDKYDGFRLYKEIRRCLCHELTHNVWGDHDEKFKTLNSRLNREVAEYERSVAQGTHHLSGGPMYEPSAELDAEARVFTLGGCSASDDSVSLANETPEERRRRVLEATMNRLRKEDEEIEHSCGTGHSTTI